MALAFETRYRSSTRAIPGWALIVAPAVLAIAVRVPFFSWPLISDEGNYAYTAYWWLRGYPLYVDYLGLERPQGIFAAYVVPLLLGGETWLIRLWAALWVAGATVAVYHLARQVLTPIAGAIAATLHATYSAVPAITGFTANSESFLIAPATFSALMLLRRRLAVAGALAALACFIKPSAISCFILAACWLAYTRASWSAFARFGICAGIVAMGFVAHGVLSAGLDAYAYNVAIFRLQHDGIDLSNPTVFALRRWLETAGVWLPLAIPFGIGLRHLPRHHAVFLLAWLCATIAGLFLGRGWIVHYWIPLIAPLSVGAGIGITAWWQRSQRVVRLAAVTIVLIPVLALVPAISTSPKEGALRLFGRTGYQIADEVAAYIQAHTRPDETIYVAFYEADIYYLSERRAAVPTLSLIQTIDLPGGYERAVQAVAAREPVYVLALNPPLTERDPEGSFWQALEAGYVVETQFHGVPLYRRRDGPLHHPTPSRSDRPAARWESARK